MRRSYNRLPISQRASGLLTSIANLSDDAQLRKYVYLFPRSHFSSYPHTPSFSTLAPREALFAYVLGSQLELP